MSKEFDSWWAQNYSGEFALKGIAKTAFLAGQESMQPLIDYRDRHLADYAQAVAELRKKLEDKHD